jgi:mono/diheme cytochrome c family protein
MTKKNKPDDEHIPRPEGQFRDDDEDADIYSIHSQIVSREKGEPDEGFEPTPWWVWTISVLVLFAMGYYLGKYSGTFGTVAHEVEMPPQFAEESIEREVRGDILYAGMCQTCHQANGQGVPGRYPPLAGSEWVTGDAQTPVRIVLFGLEGPIVVRGNTYNELMDPFHQRLNDREIAGVVNYIRTTWENEASEVTPEIVSELREQHEGRGRWRTSELEALRTSE